jgi:hypothetical protein
MTALFQSVDRSAFDLALLRGNDRVMTDFSGPLAPHEILRRLPEAMHRSDENDINVMIRPAHQARPDQPRLIRLDNLSAADLDVVGPCSFMVLHLGGDRYQAWLAVDHRTPGIDLSRGQEKGSNTFVPLAGGTLDGRKVRIVDGIVGLLTSTRQLHSDALRPFLNSGVIQ